MIEGNIALTGGGTGGHIYPCLALAEELKEYKKNTKASFNLFYLGNPQKLEAKLLTENELTDFEGQKYQEYIEFLGVDSEPFVKNPIKIPGWFFRFFKNKNDAKKKLEEKNISVVFGTGGYAAGPIFAACKELGIPYIIHNLDAHMGLANRAFINDAFALTLGVADLGIKPSSGKVAVTGNPISKKFLLELEKLGSYQRDNKKLHLLITGGSQGAQAINEAIGNILDELEELNLEIVHVTGKKTYAEYVDKFLDGDAKKYSWYTVLDYVHNMPELCAWSDLSICRSGAMTIAEMAASDTVPIFVPLPWAAHDHQNKNAQELVDTCAAMLLDQEASNFETLLFYLIQGFANEPARVDSFLDQLQHFKKLDVSHELISIIEEASA